MKATAQRRGRHRAWYALIWSCVLMSVVIGTTQATWAQVKRWLPDTTERPELIPIWGMPLDTFMIGANSTKWIWPSVNDFDDLHALWRFADSMGTDLLWVGLGSAIEDYDRLDTSSFRRPYHKLQVSVPNVYETGLGKEVQFYPFDSTESPYWVAEFTQRSGGTTVYNPVEIEEGPPRRELEEQVYDTTNTTAWQPIGSNIGVNLDEVIGGARSLYENYKLLDESRIDPGDSLRYIYFFVVQGHLFDQGAASLDSTIFHLEVWHEIPAGVQYRVPADGSVAVAQSDTAILLRTFEVTKGQLTVPVNGETDLNLWRTISFPADMRESDGLAVGPLSFMNNFPNAGSRAIDLRVRWSGLERAALRMVAVRDWYGEMALGNSAEALAWRNQAIQNAQRVIWGPDRDPDDWREWIISLECGTEQSFDESIYGGFDAMDGLVRSTFSRSTAPGDSLPAKSWVGPVAHREVPNFIYNTDQRTMYVYAYLNDPRDRVLSDNGNQAQARFDIPYHQIPTLSEMNGGRFDLPELVIDTTDLAASRQAVEDYTLVLQRSFVGRNDPDIFPFFPLNSMHGIVGGMAQSARTMRSLGGRSITMLGDVMHLSVDKKITYEEIPWPDTLQASDGSDSIVTTTVQNPIIDSTVTASHPPTPEELKMLANCGLAYGSRGLVHYLLASDPTVNSQIVTLYDTAHTTWSYKLLFKSTENSCCYGACGYFTRDTTQNIVDEFDLYLNSLNAGVVYQFDSLYIGWQDRSRSVKWLNRYWLREIGPELVKLRWRDAYSMHWQALRPGTQDTGMSTSINYADGSTDDTLVGFTPRPLPSDEIISEVQARSPWSATDDPLHETYVEIGLFETENAEWYNPYKDTNYIFVTNRRTFARPPTVDPDTWRGRMMDTLAETRLVTLTFNLKHPIEETSNYEQYTFIRVEEIVKDTTTPPLYAAAPPPLDTIIYADSAVTLTLAPGAGSLLRITYVEPDTSLIAGELRFNSQRKLLFDGRRWHATYMRWHFDPWFGGSWNDTIFYRRSFPVNDQTTGTVLWEPVEFPVSIDGVKDRFENRFPSMTLRFVPRPGGTDTLITIVWTCHQDNSCPPLSPNCREVVGRDLNMRTGMHSNIWLVDTYDGPSHAEWGTPVVSSLHGADVIAWSDINLGVRACARIIGGAGAWWTSPRPLTPVLNVSAPQHCGTGVGRYPSMPPFAHRASLDSNAGIVWNQPQCNGTKHIGYARLEHYNQVVPQPPPNPPLLVPSLRRRNLMYVSPVPGNYFRPSIDQTQDFWHRVQEGVTWEEDFGGASNTFIWFRSLFTETRSNPTQDVIEPTQLWSWARTVGPKVTGVSELAYPNTASLNEVYTSVHSGDSAFFTVQFMDYPNISGTYPMRQGMIRYAYPNFKSGWPRTYAFEGHYPNGSSSPVRQADHHAVLYGTRLLNGDSILRTSRQFFAYKQRPGNYLAEGREAVLLVDAETVSGFSVALEDVWFADAERSEPVSLAERSDASERIDDLERVRALMRTGTVSLADSTTVGLKVRAQWFGDTTTATGAAVTLRTELVEETSGEVIHEFDGVTMRPGSADYEVTVSDELDLLSGEYYVRLRLDTSGFTVERYGEGSLYQVGEIAYLVEGEETAKRATWAVPGAATIRVDVQPNPFTAVTEIRYSVPEAGRVSVVVHDERGREVVRLVDGEQMEGGRYSAGFTAGDLATGAYLVEVRLERHGVVRARSVERIVLQR